MEVAVYNKEGKETGRKVTLDSAVFGVEPNDHLIYLAVKQYRANQRQGTHSSKEKSQLSGSTRKLKRQKGTGTARAGSIKSPLFRGGARVFGPHPRQYSIRLNKKVKQLARVSALSYKAQEDAIKVVENITMDAPKTKEMKKVLKNLELNDTKNLQGVSVISVSDLNTYQILKAKKILVFEDAVSAFSDLALDNN
ncbi:MAG: 50S ribosomal protein L4 [Bacteroidia bacterium]|nr:MAG: 50S ribosomal protein L4 [Bacteroidia bacterium]